MGTRIFDVSINGRPALVNLNVATQAGGPDIALDFVFNNIIPNTQGQIVVLFTGTTQGTDHNAKVGAVALDPQWYGVLPAGLQENNSWNYSNVAEFAFMYTQLSQLAQQGYVTSGFVSTLASPQTLRMNDDEIEALTSTGMMVLGDDQLVTPKMSSLMMTGDRVMTSVPIARDIAGQVPTAEASFVAPAAISTVTRCVVSSNMLINNAAGFALSFVMNELAASPAAPVAPSGPVAQVIVASNVLQGLVFQTPQSTSLDAVNSMT